MLLKSKRKNEVLKDYNTKLDNFDNYGKIFDYLLIYTILILYKL